MKATFYYEDGSKVNLADGSALFSFARLNYTNRGFNEQEYVGVTDTIELIQIIGSSIVYKDGKLGATSSNNTITKYIDITTGKEISKQEDGKQPKKDIPGYEFVETKDER